MGDGVRGDSEGFGGAADPSPLVGEEVVLPPSPPVLTPSPLVGEGSPDAGSTGEWPYDLRRFAILEHDWGGVHWDFLVEDGPALRTWAVDAPIVEGVSLPARALPAHRRVYLDYEGEVSGGRGTVRRWDGGECRAIEWGEAAVRLEVRGAQLVGVVEFRRVEEDGRRSWRFRFGKLS